MPRTIYWVRRDLRLDDNPALQRAARAEALVFVYLHDDSEEGPWPLGGAQRWWLARSLVRFDESLRALGSRLVVMRRDAEGGLLDLAKRLGAREVVWSRRFDPAGLAQERRVEAALDRAGVAWSAFHSNHLYDPDEIATKEGRPYQVYTPFSRNCRARPAPAKPKGPPSALPPCDGAPQGIDLARVGVELELEPKVDWAAGMRAMWTPGEAGARARLSRFVGSPLGAYPEGRDDPSVEGSSLLSPHLAFGEIGIRRIWHTAADAKAQPSESIEKFHSELLWREFATHVLAHFPHTDLRPLRPEYAKFPWRSDAAALEAWKRGRTGYPLVDAGMRQLWTTGWMHNRVRMVVASFLVKHLLLPWQDGARWFWETLLDADLGNNSLGWQWSAGSGADAAPYFRIFNPTSQAEKFDPEAAYVKRWVPELARLPAKYALAPWDAPPLVLSGAGVELGREYPRPVVEHAMARSRALEALSAISKSKGSASKDAASAARDE